MKLLSVSMFSGEGSAFSAELITLKNRNGLVAQFTNYGAHWVSMWTPDRNHLHGGMAAFHNRFWKSHLLVTPSGEEAVEFSICSPNGEEGYPGNLEVKVTYLLKENNTLRMECEATADCLTPVNLTNHAFFNLQASSCIGDKKSVLSHNLTLNASTLIECDSELIPTGRLLPVEGTLLDFRSPRTIASSLAEEHSQIQKGKGFSLPYALNKKDAPNLNFAAYLSDETSDRNLTIYTNQPSVQVYNGYFMDGTDIGKNGTPYYPSAGIAIETQGYPDAPNQPSFPSIFIDRSKRYSHITEYKFG